MRRILLVGTNPKQKAQIKQICGMSYMIDEAQQLNHVAFVDQGYAVAIVLIDENPDQVLNDLEQITLKSVSYMPPLLIASADPEALYVRKALRRGATDFLNLSSHYFLLQNRITNVSNLGVSHSSQIEAMNRLLFYRCIGPALMLEIEQETMETIHALMINSEYYKLTGIPKGYYDRYPNMASTVRVNELEDMKEAVRTARIHGIGECNFTRAEIGKTFRATFRLVTKGEDSDIYLVTLEDITDEEIMRHVSENLLRLPGMTLFDYDIAEDTAHFQITTKKDKKVTKSAAHILDPNKQKLIAPESFPLFQRTLTEAQKAPVTGNIDIRVLTDGQLKWHRMYYRSIADPSGMIIRIVGRLDDLESEDFLHVKGIHSGVCDAETHLPTYHTTCQFIEQVLNEHKQGILMLLNISGLKKSCEDMTTYVRQTFLQEIVRTMNDLFISTDLIGRFDDECFIIFMPETTSQNVASKKADLLMHQVSDLLPSDQFQVNAGICIISPQHGSLESIVSEASIALWKAARNGNGEYLIFNNGE